MVVPSCVLPNMENIGTPLANAALHAWLCVLLGVDRMYAFQIKSQTVKLLKFEICVWTMMI